MTTEFSQLATDVAPGEQTFSEYRSPFAVNELTESAEPVRVAYLSEFTSPFNESAQYENDHQLETAAVESLLADFEDEEFAEALEDLTQEASARHAAVMARWSTDATASEVAATEIEQWLEGVAEEADRRLSAISDRFGDRTIESLSELELEEFGNEWAAELQSPFDAQEDFLKRLVRKVKKVARGVVKLAKKGLSALGRLLPIGKLLGALRSLIRPLLRQVLGRAIGRLPAVVQPAARKLAARLGLQAEGAENAEYDHEGHAMAEEFDARLAAHLLAPDDTVAHTEVAEYHAASEPAAGEGSDHVASLDASRRRLADYFESAEHQADPTAAMENFIPAVLPLVKLGISIVGREKVVKLVAGLLGKLIRPMVGGTLAPVLSQAIASSGLSMIGLEASAAAEQSSLGPEALVSVAEDTVRQVFSANPEVLQNELLTAAVVQDAFTDAVSRHMPTRVLRPDAINDHGDTGGVWVMMPRRGARRYRYRAYSPLPIRIHRPMARRILFSGGETLEDRLLEAGVERFPAEVEIEAYEMLPAGELGHVVGTEYDHRSTSVADLTSQFEELDEASGLNLLMPNNAAVTGTAHGRRHRRYVRIRVGGKPLRRRSVLSMRLHFDGNRPNMTVAVRLGERQSHAIAKNVAGNHHVAVVRAFQTSVRGTLRTVIARKLGRIATRLGIAATGQGVAAAAQRLADALADAFARQIVTAAPRLAAAAQDPKRGITLVFGFSYASRDAVLGGMPTATKFDVKPGWHHG
ncbi:hypothetical protein JYB55_05605 [Mycolicibacterium septicum]|nr:hypothetical protein [Mycolicibacterium septicum]